MNCRRQSTANKLADEIGIAALLGEINGWWRPV